MNPEDRSCYDPMLHTKYTRYHFIEKLVLTPNFCTYIDRKLKNQMR